MDTDQPAEPDRLGKASSTNILQYPEKLQTNKHHFVSAECAEIKPYALVLEHGCGSQSRAPAQVQASASLNHPTSPLEK
jgi:hypothetical protein